MKKNILHLSLLFALLFSLTYCSGEKKADAPDTAPAEELQAEQDAVSEAAAPAEAATEVDAEVSEKTAPAPVRTDYSKTPLIGYVASFDDLVRSGDGKVKKGKAQKLIDRGSPIVLKAENGKVYFVYNSDGSFAGKRLAKFANEKKVAVYGSSKVLNGLNILSAHKFEKSN